MRYESCKSYHSADSPKAFGIRYESLQHSLRSSRRNGRTRRSQCELAHRNDIRTPCARLSANYRDCSRFVTSSDNHLHFSYSMYTYTNSPLVILCISSYSSSDIETRRQDTIADDQVQQIGAFESSLFMSAKTAEDYSRGIDGYLRAIQYSGNQNSGAQRLPNAPQIRTSQLTNRIQCASLDRSLNSNTTNVPNSMSSNVALRKPKSALSLTPNLTTITPRRLPSHNSSLSLICES
eukprot:IDg12016t1